jgi:hypothetical protein
VRRVLPEKFIVTVLHIEVLVLRNGLVIWDDSSTYWYIQIAGTWKPTATVAQPEQVPTREVSIR